MIKTMKELIANDDMNLLNIDYEIHSGCGAMKKIRSTSLRGAKVIATRLGFGKCTSVWLMDSRGKLLARRTVGKTIWE